MFKKKEKEKEQDNINYSRQQVLTKGRTSFIYFKSAEWKKPTQIIRKVHSPATPTFILKPSSQEVLKNRLSCAVLGEIWGCNNSPTWSSRTVKKSYNINPTEWSKIEKKSEEGCNSCLVEWSTVVKELEKSSSFEICMCLYKLLESY